MGATTDDAKELVDQIKDQQQVLAAAQARHASLMLKFSNTRRHLDHTRITNLRNEGADPRYTPGEFAALEIGLATKTNKHKISRTIGIARRLHDETPDAWDAWQAGHIDHDRAARINKALIRLTRDTSKQLLNALVVDVAKHKTVELLGRWLNEFVAMVEPDQTNDRLRRSLEDRYVSIRPDIDGISFLHAAIASADADAINQVLDALAGIALPGDTRTFQQRRADACTELLLGKISNGCHVTWQDDEDDEDDAEDWVEDDQHRDNDAHTADDEQAGNEPRDHADPVNQPADPEKPDTDDSTDTDSTATDSDLEATDNAAADITTSVDVDERPWDTDDDWDLPASAFRPDPHTPTPDGDPTDTAATEPTPTPYRTGRPVIMPCPHDHKDRPIPATIGVIISAQSLFGYSNTPGQLTDRSTLIPADLIRDLAQQPGTLFYRLMTDEKGNLLDVTVRSRLTKAVRPDLCAGLRLTTSSQATGCRFPSRKRGNALDFRDGTCTTPICTTPAHKCDHDHVIPVPAGPTTAENLQNHCGPEHRAKTHAGHQNSRDGNTSTWTTPTGHTYETTDRPFPVEQWPTEEKEPPDE